MTGTCVANTATPHGPWRFATAPVSFVDGTANAQPDSGLHGSKEEFRKVTLEIFNEAGLLRHFGISEERAIRFFDHMYKLHGEIPYHCALHSLDVLGSAHCLMMQLRELNHGPFTELEVLALYTGKGFSLSLSLSISFFGTFLEFYSLVLWSGDALCLARGPSGGDLVTAVNVTVPFVTVCTRQTATKSFGVKPSGDSV